MRLAKVFLGLSVLLAPAFAYGGDAVTIIFKSGQVVKIDDGYAQIITAIKKLKPEYQGPQFMELNIYSTTYLLNLAEVAIACRDNCVGVIIQHQLAPKK